MRVSIGCFFWCIFLYIPFIHSNIHSFIHPFIHSNVIGERFFPSLPLRSSTSSSSFRCCDCCFCCIWAFIYCITIVDSCWCRHCRSFYSYACHKETWKLKHLRELCINSLRFVVYYLFTNRKPTAQDTHVQNTFRKSLLQAHCVLNANHRCLHTRKQKRRDLGENSLGFPLIVDFKVEIVYLFWIEFIWEKCRQTV